MSEALEGCENLSSQGFGCHPWSEGDFHLQILFHKVIAKRTLWYRYCRFGWQQHDSAPESRTSCLNSPPWTGWPRGWKQRAHIPQLRATIVEGCYRSRVGHHSSITPKNIPYLCRHNGTCGCSEKGTGGCVCSPCQSLCVPSPDSTLLGKSVCSSCHESEPLSSSRVTNSYRISCSCRCTGNVIATTSISSTSI